MTSLNGMSSNSSLPIFCWSLCLTDRFSSVSALAAVVILGLGGILVVEFLPVLGAFGPWIAATVSIIAVALANRWRFKSNSWMQIDLFKRRVVTAVVENEAVVE